MGLPTPSIFAISPLPKLSYDQPPHQFFQNWFLQEVGKVVKNVLNSVLGSIDGKFLLQFSHVIQIKSNQPSRKRSF